SAIKTNRNTCQTFFGPRPAAFSFKAKTIPRIGTSQTIPTSAPPPPADVLKSAEFQCCNSPTSRMMVMASVIRPVTIIHLVIFTRPSDVVADIVRCSFPLKYDSFTVTTHQPMCHFHCAAVPFCDFLFKSAMPLLSATDAYRGKYDLRC